MNHRWGARQHYQSAIWSTREVRYRLLDPRRVARAHRADVDPQRWGHRLQCADLTKSRGLRGLIKHRHTLDPRRNFFQQFDPFRADAEFPLSKSGGVAAWTRQTRD